MLIWLRVMLLFVLQVPVSVNCSTRGTYLKEDQVDVLCPPRCAYAQLAVWGSGVYASVSSICSAAVHRWDFPNEVHSLNLKSSWSPNTFPWEWRIKKCLNTSVDKSQHPWTLLHDHYLLWITSHDGVDGIMEINSPFTFCSLLNHLAGVSS